MIEKEESETLDSIRGMAALLVLLTHVMQWFICPLIGFDHLAVSVITHAAHFAVLVFFALSGYVITHSLVTNARRNDGQIDAVAYTRSRLARILPPALAAALFSLAVAGLIHGLQMHGAESFRTEQDKWVEREAVSLRAKDVAATLLMSNGILPGTKAIGVNPPMWSLSIEFWAYFIALLAASAVCGSANQGRAARSAGLIHTIAFLLLMLIFAARPLAISQYLFYWTIGALWYFHRRHARWVNAVFGVVVVLGMAAVPRCLALKEDWNLIFENGAAGVLGIPIKGALLILLALTFPALRRLPTRRFFARVSRSSYTLYLFHYPMLCLIFSVFHLDYLDWGVWPRVLFLCVVTGGTVIACHLLATPLENKTAWLARADRVWARGVPSRQDR
ncbi:MAG: acyltransferase family protein [Limisphaerales bacterium]